MIYNEIAAGTRTYSNQLRKGQKFMCSMSDLYPELYRKITGTEMDCFYTTDVIKLQKQLDMIREFVDGC